MIKTKIQSLRETIGKNWIRPDPKKLEQYIENLQNTQHAVDYLKNERGFSDATIEHFRLGYNQETNSIAIPIFKNGELVNIKYRLLDGETRYTSERGAETWIYNEEGIEEAKKKGAVIVVEGEFDLMMVWQSGITNVISPASGKDSYGVWIEKLDNIPKVWIAYDNDIGGKETGIKIAERLGVEKCFEVNYPIGFKDANDYLKKHTKEDFKVLIKNAKPYYTYRFKNLGDIVASMRKGDDHIIKLDFIPKVKIDRDWLIVISGKSNIGKTSYVMNIADELIKKHIPTLIMPFERGIENVGKRFMQIKFEKSSEDFKFLDEEEWNTVISDCVEAPIYFSLPKKDEIIDVIVKSKRLFDTRFVIIDHLDYIVRNTTGNKEAEIGQTLQTLKRVAEEHGIIMLIVTHIRKIDSAGAQTQRKPNIEDLKGSASLYQDPECVVLLDGDTSQIHVNVVKNKGEMTSKTFTFDPTTGKLTDNVDDF